MRMRTLLLLLCTSLSAMAQEDSTKAVRNLEEHALEIGINKDKGLYAEVKNTNDTLQVNEADTIRITTQNKLYTIITTKKKVVPEEIDVEQEMKEARTQRRNVFTYWSGLDIGLNNWMDPGSGLDLPEDKKFMELDAVRSRFFAINFMEQKVEFGSHHAGLLTGLGVEFTSYHFANNILLASDADSTFAVDEGLPSFNKNKLRQIGLRVPLMLEFNTKRAPLPTEELIRSGKHSSYSHKGNVHIAFGVVGSLYFDTMYKQKYSMDGDRFKDRSKDDLNLLPYRLAGTVRVGYGGLNLFAEYGLTELFKDGKGPELVPVTVGLTLVGFN